MLVDEASLLSQVQRAQLLKAIGCETGTALPTIADVVGLLGASAFVDIDEEVRVAEPFAVGVATTTSIYDSLLLASEEAPPEVRVNRIALLSAVVATAALTWTGSELVHGSGHYRTPDTVIVVRPAPLARISDSGSVALADANAAAASYTVGGAVVGQTPTTSPPPGDTTAESQSSRSVSSPLAVVTPTSVTSNGSGVRSLPPVRSGNGSPARSVDTLTRLTELQPGRLTISSRPWGYLFVGESLVGETPASDVVLAPGKHRIRVVRDGYRSYESEIIIEPGSRLRILDLVLSPGGP
jgi:hypothetical protein